MNIRDVIRTLNEMEASGVIERYAIGGAVGATFYLEPVATLDVDVFVAIREEKGSLLISLEPMLGWLKARGHVMQGEYVMISGWPVQFLVPTGPVVEEALREAIQLDVEGESVRVFSADHLAVIALQTGRAKDNARLLQFFEEGAVDADRFHSIVERHGLDEAWHRFELRFLK